MLDHIAENPSRLQLYRRLASTVCEARNLAEELADTEKRGLEDKAELEEIQDEIEQLIYELEVNAAYLENVEQFIDEFLEDK